MSKLLFDRIARNFIKNGYFPTDEVTMHRVLSALDVSGNNVRILDPCCGEGWALASAAEHLTEAGASVQSYGVEFDRERAWHAKSLLNVVAHADVNDVFGAARSMGLLFLNPPYGDLVSDKAQTGDGANGAKRDRLEKMFIRKTMPFLQIGGVLVLIVPHYVLDGEFATIIGRNFTNVRVYMASEQRFKQAVVFGLKRHSSSPEPCTLVEIERAFNKLAPELPETWTDEKYDVPPVKSDDVINFQITRLDAPQLESEIKQYFNFTLWPQFGMQFRCASKPARRPLRNLSKWHLALALASGQVSGFVESSDGRKLLVKGNTFKEKDVVVERTTDEDGNVSEVRTLTDKFVPVIRGIDFTPGASLGQIVEIR